MLGRLLVAVLLASGCGGAAEVIRFERVFPGAVPERFEAALASDGSLTYAEGGEDPVEFSVGDRETAWVFERAAALDHFAKSLASTRRVASTGAKTLRYESDGTVRGTAHFDYSEIREARELASWFAKLAETQQHLVALERALRFDRLGVNQALVRLEEAHERNRIVAAGILVPVLERIADQQRLVHLARARAQGLLERIAAEGR